jgi:hypothetical protein
MVAHGRQICEAGKHQIVDAKSRAGRNTAELSLRGDTSFPNWQASPRADEDIFADLYP